MNIDKTVSKFDYYNNYSVKPYSKISDNYIKTESNEELNYNLDDVDNFYSELSNSKTLVEKSSLKESVDKLKFFILGKSKESIHNNKKEMIRLENENPPDLNSVKNKLYLNNKFKDLIRLIEPQIENEKKPEIKNTTKSNINVNKNKKYKTSLKRHSNRTKEKIKYLNEELKTLNSPNLKTKTQIINNINIYDIHCHTNNNNNISNRGGKNQTPTTINIIKEADNTLFSPLKTFQYNRKINRTNFFEKIRNDEENLSKRLFSPQMREQYKENFYLNKKLEILHLISANKNTINTTSRTNLNQLRSENSNYKNEESLTNSFFWSKNSSRFCKSIDNIPTKRKEYTRYTYTSLFDSNKYLNKLDSFSKRLFSEDIKPNKFFQTSSKFFSSNNKKKNNFILSFNTL